MPKLHCKLLNTTQTFPEVSSLSSLKSRLLESFPELPVNFTLIVKSATDEALESETQFQKLLTHGDENILIIVEPHEESDRHLYKQVITEHLESLIMSVAEKNTENEGEAFKKDKSGNAKQEKDEESTTAISSSESIEKNALGKQQTNSNNVEIGETTQ